MALTLTAGIAADDTTFEVTGTVPAEIVPGAYRFRLDDEVLDLVGFGRTIPTRGWPVDPNVWLVVRGVLDTTPATHEMGATVEGVVDAYIAGADEDAPDPIPAGSFEAVTAATVEYDNTESGLAATTAQGAIDELAGLAFKKVTRHLGASDILGLFDSDFVILDGVAGKAFIPVAAVLSFVAGNTPYASGGDGWYVSIPGGLGVGTFDIIFTAMATVAVGTDSAQMVGAAGGGSGALDHEGQDIVLATGADLTDGDGTADVTVWYFEIDLA